MATPSLIPAFRKGSALKNNILSVIADADAAHFDLWWLGQSGFLLHWDKQCLLFDPYLSDSLTKKYATTNKPHVRMSELVIAPELLDMVDLVTSSHNHTDHLDAETLVPLFQNNPNIEFIVPEANRQFVCDRLKCSTDFPAGLLDGRHINRKGFDIHGVPAAHNTIERDENGHCKFMGFVVQFGKWSVYHSGDTLWFDGLVEILKPFDLTIAFLPINGNDPSRGVAGNLNAKEAVLLGHNVGAQLVIPHHYHMFAFNTANPSDFVIEAESIGQPVKVLKLGEHFRYS